MKVYFEKSRRQIIFNWSSSGRGEKGIKSRYYEATKAHALTKVGYTPKRSFTGIMERLESGEITYRMLTPNECEYLQTVPQNYTDHVSKSQRYKMLGNGWTVDVIAHILRYAKKEIVNDQNA